MNKRSGFTLIEILVVVAIIGLLIGIIMPSMAESRRLSKKMVCLHNLQQIGTGIHAYLQVNRDTFFHAASLPTAEEKLAQEEGRKPLPSMPTAIKTEMGARGRSEKFESKVFLCPADEIKNPVMLADPLVGRRGPRYFDSQMTSYEWQAILNGVKLNYRNLKLLDVWRSGSDSDWRTQLKEVPIAYDYETFHGRPEQIGTLNILYLDFHVESDKHKGFGG